MRRVVFLFVLLSVLFFVSLFVSGGGRSLVGGGGDFGEGVGEGLVVYFFYGEGCPHCARVKPLIDRLESEGVRVRRFEVFANRDNLRLLNEYFERFSVPVADRGVPAVFVGSSYLVGDADILDGLEGLLRSYSDGDGSSVVVDELVEEGGAYGSEGLDGMGCLSFLVITVAALVDSINPCSMAILFFLLAGLLLLRKRKKALRVGLAFTLSVFVANLLFGFGILSAVVLTGLSGVFKVAAGVIAILTGVLLLKDAFFYGAGGFKMEVPEFLRPYLKRRLSKAFYGKSSSLIGAFLVGFLVTSFEVPCTGGPYFYVLARMADDATRMQTIPILLYYNLIFVLPLVLITVLLYFGSVHVERAREWKERNKRLIDFVRGLPMIAVGLITLPAMQMMHAFMVFLNVYRAIGIPLLAVLISYLAYQYLSKHENRSRMVKWTCMVALTAMIVLVAITSAQTINIKQIEESKSASSSALALPSCPNEPDQDDPITECCVIDSDGRFYLIHDLQAEGDCIIIETGSAVLNCEGYSIIGNGTGIGVNVSYGTPSVIRNCIIKNFEFGIRVMETGEADILYNVISSNTGWGIYLYGDGNFIKGNIIVDNPRGIVLQGSYNNLIYNNYLRNTIRDAATDSISDWNTTITPGENIIGGPYIGGNYWHDYMGEDSDGNGIGDTPYDIIAEGMDYLPLVDIQEPRYYNTQAPSDSIPYSPSGIYIFNITWKDNVQIDEVIFELDGVNYTPEKIDEYLGFNSNYQVEYRANYSISFQGLEPGTHTYRWYANDTRDNWNSTQLYNFTIVEDNIPPSIEIISPKNITYYNYLNIKLEFTINEAASWIAYSLDHQENTTIFTNVEAGTYTKYIYIPNYGSHNIIVYAKDTAGNTGKSERIHFTTKRIWGGGGSFRCLIMLY